MAEQITLYFFFLPLFSKTMQAVLPKRINQKRFFLKHHAREIHLDRLISCVFFISFSAIDTWGCKVENIKQSQYKTVKGVTAFKNLKVRFNDSCSTFIPVKLSFKKYILPGDVNLKIQAIDILLF